MTGIRVGIESLTTTHLHDACQIDIQIQHHNRPWSSIMLFTLEGRECDFVDTVVREATSAWMYGERWQDVVRNVKAVKKLAAAHARSTM